MRNYSFYLTVFILVTLLCLWCCTACMNESNDADLPNDSDVENTSDPDTDANGDGDTVKPTENPKSSEDDDLKPSDEVNKNTDEPAKEVELAECVSNNIKVYSLEELHEQITAIKALSPDDERYSTYAAMNFSSTEYYYIPDIEIEGYELKIIFIYESLFLYIYTPIGNPDTLTDIVYFTIAREPEPSGDTFASPLAVYGGTVEDGKLVHLDDDSAFFEVEPGHLGLVQLPESLAENVADEKSLLESLCKVRKVYVNSDHVTE